MMTQHREILRRASEKLGGMTASSTLPSALASWADLSGWLRGGAPALFLDYDGTLTPIVQRPEDALLSDAARAAVRAVAAVCPVTIVSGRDRTVVEELVGVDGLGYIGSHGFDIGGPAGSALRHEVGGEHLPALDAAERLLRDRLAAVPGTSVERKRFGVAVHYRQALDRRSEVEAAVRAVEAEQSGLRLAAGKTVFELRPAIDWNKGRAIRWVLDHWPGAHGLPIHIGDDLTDETAFDALAGDGLGVVVAKDDRPTAAQFVLRDPDEVRVFLERLARALRPSDAAGSGAWRRF